MPQSLNGTNSALPAVLGGNFTGNGASMNVPTLALWWCGNSNYGYSANSPCANGSVSPGFVQGSDVVFSYCPGYPSCVDPNYEVNFAATQGNWVVAIESAALAAFKKAFSNYPIVVQAANATYSCSTDSVEVGCNLTGITGQTGTIYIVGDIPNKCGPLATSCGYNMSSGSVNYNSILSGAQQALGTPVLPTGSPTWTDGDGWTSLIIPSYPPNNVPIFNSFLQALGTGIGNAAVHEAGHLLELISVKGFTFPGMDCGLGLTPNTDPDRPLPIACEFNNNFVYSFYNQSGEPQVPTNESSQGGMFFYGVPGGTNGVPTQQPIHWEPVEDCWLQNWTVFYTSVFSAGCQD